MNTFLAIFNAFPAILQTVQAVEQAIPISNAGQQKMNLVLGAAATAFEVGQVGEQVTKTNWLAGIEAMTNIAVAGLNAAGVFGKHPTAATPAAAPAAMSATIPAAPVSSN